MPYTNLAQIADQRFGMLVALQYAGSGKWLCRCDCGKFTEVITSNLTRGNSKSCGCQLHPKKHGMAHHPVNQVWRAMRARCNNPNDPAYANYGGRGIKVCERWDDFALFVLDMGPRPKGHQIDRTDNEKGYSPENCRWVLPKENLNNKRSSRKIDWCGETLTITQWAERLGVKPRTLFNRIDRGMSLDEAMTRPVARKERLN